MRSEASMGIYMVRGVGWVNRSVQSLSLIQTLHSQLPLVGGWLLSSLTDYTVWSLQSWLSPACQQQPQLQW